MSDNTLKVSDFLKDWQYTVHEDVITLEDIQVYNVVGTIGQLLSSEYMDLSYCMTFVWNCLSLSEEVKDRIEVVFTNACNSSVVLH